MRNNGYQADFLYQLKSKNDIVDIVSRYVHLERRGKNYWGCCPFHNEKTPSFSVNQDEGYFYCFGCKESGDVISFLQKMESCDFSDAVKILAENAHMTVPEFEGNPDEAKRKNEKQRILQLLDCAYKHYQENLYLPDAKKAQDYIKMRLFTRRELEDFKLGYSLSTKEMVTYLRRLGFTYKELVDAGVAQEKNGYYYDCYAERLIFPIFNSMNECVGFSARVLEKTDYAKYKNTAETLVFKKGRVVYGINLLKKLKQAGGLDQIIIVEGQIDVIAMHRAGFKSAVACLGTALTTENAHELRKICDKVVLCFDGDEAGQKATLRSIDILKAEGFSIKIATLPDKQDPDEVIKNQGKEVMAQIIADAKSVTDFLIDLELGRYNLDDAEEKGKFVKAVIAHLRKLSSVEAEPYLEKLRALSNVPIDILRRDLLSDKPAPSRQEEKKTADTLPRENGELRAVKFVLASLIHQKDYLSKQIDYQKLLPRFQSVIEQAKQKTPISSYFDLFDVENNPTLKDALFFNFDEIGQSQDRYFSECLWQLAEAALQEKQKELNLQFKNSTDLQERTQILKQLADITKQLKEKSLEDFYDRQ